MQTLLTIDDKLFSEATKIAAIQDPNQLVEAALREFIVNHQQPKKNNLLDLFGAGGIANDYDYKALRNGGDQNVSG